MCCWRPQSSGMLTTVASAPHVRRLGLAITIAGFAGILLATLFPDSDSPIASHFCLICGSRGGVDAVLNIILFVPLGIGLGLLGARARLALSAMCVLSALIETTQFFFIAGRDATIGDVVMNTLGGALGLVIGRHAFTLLRPSSRIALLLSVGGSIVWLAIQTVSASGFSPAIPSSEYYGEIARQLGHFEQFRGRVLHASIADVPVPDTRFADSRKVRELLDHGATVTTTVLPAGRTHGIAPIVRVADARQREIVLVAQDGDKLIFGVRTRAVVLGFRPPVFALSDLFPAVARRDIGLTTDTIAMRASYSTREARLNAQTARVTRDRRIATRTSLAWTMVLPFQWHIEGTSAELLVSGIWIAWMLIPIGYWGEVGTRLFRGADTARARVILVSIAVALLYVGLVVVPLAFGLSPAPRSDWLASVIGTLLGAAIATRVAERDAVRGSTA